MKLIPTGIENFKTMIDKNAYYVDKTNLIADILNEQVVLYTRPRRFGKTLNMSMLYYFFSIKEKENAYLFNDLYISKNKEALEHQNKYPTIFISLKEMKNLTFDAQISSFSSIIYELLEKNLEILSASQLTDATKKKLNSLHDETTSIEDLKFSLRIISNALYTYYHQKVIILIDEYDVPLQSAYQNNYYDEMVDFLRSVFSSALKTNDALEKGIMTGCLRISKESIFTGLNNFTSYSILNNIGNEYFGFNENEVKQLLEDYQLSSYMDEVKEWYDGYLFGNIEIYNPWSTLMYVDCKLNSSDNKPISFWANTSGNDLVKRFIDNANKTTRDEIERLVAGEAIEKMVRLELTYDEIDNSIDNMWSVLFTTGYLTQTGMTEQGAYKLVIPNKEVREVYKFQIQEWFKKSVFSNTEQLTAFWNGVEEGNTEAIEKYLNRILSNSISVFDTKAPDKESSYHTLLVGLLVGNANWLVKSNVEAGEGFADIIVETENPDAGIVMELKYVKVAFELEKACEKALAQIKDRRYEEYLKNDGRNNILVYGLAFCKKRCKVIVESRGM